MVSSPTPPPNTEPGVTLDQLDQLEETILQGLRFPLTGMLLVDEQEISEALNQIRESFPQVFEQAQNLMDQRQDYLKQTRSQGTALLQQAREKREQLIQQSIQESERRTKQAIAEAAAQRDKLLEKVQQEMAQKEQALQKALAQMEQQFMARRNQLEQEYNTRKEQQHQQLEQQRIQGLQELERIRQDMQSFRQKTHTQCEELTRQATAAKQEADRYARQVLDDLNSKLRELQQVVGTQRQQWNGNHAHPPVTATPRIRGREDRKSA